MTDESTRHVPPGSDGDSHSGVDDALQDFVEALESALPIDSSTIARGASRPLESFGPYRIDRRLGAGGMGEVYVALDSRLGRQVALKILSGRLLESLEWKRRFLAEARMAASLNHSRICVVYEVGETDAGSPYIAMELVEGQPLSEHARATRLEVRDVVELGLQIADALAAAHEQGVVHRDIKPANVMITPSGGVKVLDFGLAKRFPREGRGSDAESLVDTQPGRVAGTPLYMSPEQARGERVDHRTDIFSVGTVLYELLTGRPPFVGESIDDTLHRILHADPPDLGVDAPEPFRRILELCLAKRREGRYATALELRDALLSLRRALGDTAAQGDERGGHLDLALQGVTALPPPESVRNSDILINCAMLDDLPLTVDRKGWVSEFQRHLQVRLAQLWGEPVKVARTSVPAGETPTPERFREYVEGVKTMVSIVSPPFVKAGGCRQQVEEFCRTAEATGGLWAGDKPRLLKVVKTPADTRGLSSDLGALFERLVAFEFFETDPQTGRVREYDELLGADGRQRFFERIYDVALELCLTLQSYETGDSNAFAPPTGVTIYLAETTADLQNERDRLRRELQDRGHIVLPAHPLPNRIGDLESTVRECLRRSTAAIHLIGDRYGFVPEGATESIVELQHRWSAECLRDGSLQRFIWMPPGMTCAEDRQARFVEFLRSDPETHETTEVICGVLNSLKRLVSSYLESLRAPTSSSGVHAAGPSARPASAANAAATERRPPLVYLICDAPDEAEASRVQEWLFDAGLEVSLPDFEADEAEFTRNHQELLASADGVLIYYGNVRRSWVETKLRDLMKAAGWGRSRPFAAKALYVPPDGDPRRRQFRTHLADSIHAAGVPDGNALRPFVERLEKLSEGSRS